ncbi:MAG: ROK family transcriptional regulator [Lachnospiraceae bacterium]|nr:ROK family transcriptional regulator [Lachnospiraceae bacterium]MCI9135581.1 ROK family transcriptional regulator [Lachnospiraceae bacterium]
MKLMTQQIIKNNNLKNIYALIQRSPDISRAQLAKICNLSKTTVSSLVDELINRKFIQDTGSMWDTISVGRKPNGLQLCSGQYYVIVLSWHYHEIRIKQVDICGQIASHFSLRLSGGHTYISASRQLFDQFLASGIQKNGILGICLVVPAMIDIEKRKIFSTTLNDKAYDPSTLVEQFRSAFSGYPLAILNDTACAAYAEKIYTKMEQEDFAYINFQHGIGAALFIHNQLLGHATASYTQFGHFSIDPKGKLCSCGNRGCLELMICEDSLKDRILALGQHSELKKEPVITYASLGSAALYGDTSAQKVIQDLAVDFSYALTNLVCLVRPKIIIIGGKGKDLGPLFLQEVKKNLSSTGFRQMIDSMDQIRYSMLDPIAYFIGAMKYFFDIHYDFSQDLTNQIFLG